MPLPAKIAIAVWIGSNLMGLAALYAEYRRRAKPVAHYLAKQEVARQRRMAQWQ